MLWDEYVRLHHDEKYYPVDDFLKGEDQLKEIEIAEVGDVRGKQLLHLQCHFGLDSLSWARDHGAIVTGVDFSLKAIQAAQMLADELKLDARFIQSNVLELPEELHKKFDVVFTSYGVLTWLPELKTWGQQIAKCLKPGGFVYVCDEHPTGRMMDDETEELRLRYPYFKEAEPMRFDGTGSYATPEGVMQNMESVEWAFTIGEVIGSLIAAGLSIEFFNEHDHICWKMFPRLVQGEDGWWRMPVGEKPLPLLFSLKARKVRL